MRDPVNSFALGQQSTAVQWAFAKAMGRKGGKRSAARRRKKVAATRTQVKRRRRKTARLVKGSAAAKAYMAKIRRKRRK